MKKFIRFLFILLLVILLILIYGRYEGTSGLITKEYKIDTSDIDNSFDGLKIVQFSDLHYLRVVNKDMVKKIVNEINLINPDIVIFTGDLIDKDFNPTDSEENDLITLLSSINSKYGKYAIIGNHDYVKKEGIIEDIYKQSDFILLQNSYDIIYGNDNDDINYKIILVHEPDYIDTITSKYNVNLVLAGHSHNGQVNIPFIKNFFLPYGSKKYYDNYYMVDDTPMYVSSGIGESRVNLRLFNRPSINFYRINKI